MGTGSSFGDVATDVCIIHRAGSRGDELLCLAYHSRSPFAEDRRTTPPDGLRVSRAFLLLPGPRRGLVGARYLFLFL